MVTGSEKHVAKLAVSRYGADSVRVRQALQAVLQAQTQGKPADLLERLVAERLLTEEQASELRADLDTTHFDLKPPGARTGPPAPPLRPDTTPNGKGGTDPASPALPHELRILGDYRILRPLGEGGMGAVYLGYHEQEKKQVAIKVLNDQLSSLQASVDRFYREAKSLALLDHPNIVRNIAVGQDRATNKHYLVLEYVDGPSAHALLDQFGRLSVGDAVHIVLDIARALEHAHSRNIVHRDIKPDNILMTRSGLAKLADLGLAKRTDETSHLTAARQGFGTPYYMPYEQAMNAKSADGRSDIYALGATLYHLVTGEVPFAGSSHVEIVEKKNLGLFTPASVVNPEVPEELDRILDKMLARDQRDRYQTTSELIVDLERANLAAAVPSFVDTDLALQDPLVRARLTAPAQPTSPDLQRPVKKKEEPAGNGNPDLWYLRFRDRSGQWCKAKATTRQVLQRLREGRMPLEVEASHDPQGKFQALPLLAEFREAALNNPRRKKPAPADKPEKPAGKVAARAEAENPAGEAADAPTFWEQWWLLLLALGVVLGIGGLVGLLFLL
jgi:serine/threonine-protein kinase